MKIVQPNRGYELFVGEVRKLSHSASYLFSPNSPNHYSIALDCLKLSKSISSKTLRHRTCLQTIYIFWRASVHFAQKYWHSVRVHKRSALSYKTNEKPNSAFLVQKPRNHNIDENFHGENFKWDEVHRMPITFAANFRRNCA
jgi:hypothetical protein